MVVTPGTLTMVPKVSRRDCSQDSTWPRIYHLYPARGLDPLIAWEGEKADEGGGLHFSVPCRMLPGMTGRVCSPSPAVIVEDCPHGLARGLPEKIGSGCQFPNCTASAALWAEGKNGGRVIVCQMGNLYAGQCFFQSTVLFSSRNFLSLAWYL